MLRLATYITRMMIPWLMLSVSGAALIFVVSQAVRVAPIFVGAESAGLLLLKALGLLLVPVVGWALTPALAVSIFAVFGKMAARGEQTALDAAGVPRWKAAVGPLIVCILMAAMSSWIWLDGSWRSQQSLRAVALDLAGRALVGRMEPGRFVEPMDGLTFFADDRDPDGGFRGVVIHDRRNPERVVQLFARSASVSVDNNGEALRIDLAKGRIFVEPSSRAGPTVVSFDTLHVDVGVFDELASRTGFIPGMMSSPTQNLWERSGDSNEIGFALWRRFAGPLGLCAIGLASLLLVLGGRWRRSWTAMAAGAGLFLVYHLAGRFGEALMGRGVVGPGVAAFGPGIAVIVLALILILIGRLGLLPRAAVRRC